MKERVFFSFPIFFAFVFDDEAIGSKKRNPAFSPSRSLSFPLSNPQSDARESSIALSEVSKENSEKHLRSPTSVEATER